MIKMRWTVSRYRHQPVVVSLLLPDHDINSHIGSFISCSHRLLQGPVRALPQGLFDGHYHGQPADNAALSGMSWTGVARPYRQAVVIVVAWKMGTRLQRCFFYGKHFSEYGAYGWYCERSSDFTVARSD